MTNNNTGFKRTMVARALIAAFGMGVLATAYSPVALAQSSASGIVFGTAAPGAGTTVLLRNLDTNATRSIAVDAAGKFQATAVPAGRYSATLMRGADAQGSSEIDVIAGQGTQTVFAMAGVQSVDIKGKRTRIDVSSTNNGAVFTARDLAKLPIATNLTAVVLLAPNTVRSDPAYGGASFGGSGASENAYYINGFPVTNPLSNLGSSELPFGAIAQASVITGGFGAEFGRSIGGVMNVTTKSGSNHWEVGATVSVAPESMTSKSQDIYYPNTGAFPRTDGKLHFRRSLSTSDQTQSGAYVGGPIIADKLFMFLAADHTVTNNGFANSQTNTTLARDGWNDQRTTGKRYLAKFDWNLNDNHRLEWTSIGDQSTLRARTYGYDPVTGAHNNVKYSELSARNTVASAPANPDANAKNINGAGSDIRMLKYIGQWTPDLTVTALVGQNKGKRSTVYEDYDIHGILRSVQSNPEAREPGLDAQGLYKNYQKYNGAGGLLGLPGMDTVKSARIDLEYKLGAHMIRAGVDDNRIASSNVGAFAAGGGIWTYLKVEDGAQFEPTLLSVGRAAILANYGGLGTKGYYASLFTFSSITESGAQQSAQYIEDRYQVTDRLLVTAGLRNEQYSNSFGTGIKFVDIKNQLAPRLAAAWDVNGDATLKIFGSAGRYHLQLPSQVAARAAGVSSYLQQDFTYSGIDGKGQPTGLVKINEPGSPNGEWGQIKDPRATVSKTLKPNFQDELTLGFEMAYSPMLNFGAKATYRKLGGGIDDSCDTRPISRYAAAHGYQPDPLQLMCYIFNPGDDVTLWSRGVDGSGRYVTFSAAELGYPKAKRNYAAIDVFAEHPLRNGWYGKLNYTLSRSSGNMEGQTRSDTQQADVGISAGWDFPEFMAHASGVLPNDRPHVFKAYGFVELNPEWTIGGNLLLSSGRSKACIGTNVELDQYIGYGPEYFHCDNKPSPRGSLGRMPLQTNLDLNVSYTPAMLKGVALKMDVFNVANKQTVLTRRDIREGGDGAILSNYGEVRNTQPARSVRLAVEYKHRF
jgi:hypothetical protein